MTNQVHLRLQDYVLLSRTLRFSVCEWEINTYLSGQLQINLLDSFLYVVRP